MKLRSIVFFCKSALLYYFACVKICICWSWTKVICACFLPSAGTLAMFDSVSSYSDKCFSFHVSTSEPLQRSAAFGSFDSVCPHLVCTVAQPRLTKPLEPLDAVRTLGSPGLPMMSVSRLLCAADWLCWLCLAVYVPCCLHPLLQLLVVAVLSVCLYFRVLLMSMTTGAANPS